MRMSSQHNLCSLLEAHAQTRPAHTALLEVRSEGKERRLSYAELNEAVARFSGSLASRGIAAGDRVLVFVPMSLELYVVLLGLFHHGATAVFIDPGMRIRQIRAALRLSNASLVLVTPKVRWLQVLFPSLWRRRWLSVCSRRMEKLLESAPKVSIAEVEYEHPALLTFTSGTTGQPKGVMRSHRFLLKQHSALTNALGTSPQDIEMPVLPIFLLNTLAAGATAVIPPVGRRVADVHGQQIVDIISRYEVTTCSASPAFYEALVPYLSAQACETVRAFFIGGAPVAPNLISQLEPHLPNGGSVVVYGSTEAEPVSEIHGHTVLTETARATAAGAGLCVGLPVNSVSVRIDGDATVGGEVLVAGEHVNKAYYQDPLATAETKVTDERGVVWHRTGDIARIDELGRLWLLGRKSAVIERNGRRLYPFAAELAARAREGVRQAALVTHGAEVVLVVEGAIEQVQELVGADTGIDRLLAIPRMPTDVRHNAKIDYAKLQRWLRRHG